MKVFGDDMAVMESTAEQISKVLQGVPGAADVKVEQTTGLPMLTVQIDRAKLARLGLNMAEVQRRPPRPSAGVRPARCSKATGALTSWCACRSRCAATSNTQAPADQAARGATAYAQLGDVASFEIAPGPNQISQESSKRRVVVTANVRGRDIGSFVADAQAQLQDKVKVPRRLLDELGWHLRTTAVGQRAPADRRARGLAAGSSCCCLRCSTT